MSCTRIEAFAGQMGAAEYPEMGGEPLRFRFFDPKPCRFPPPRIPLLPLPSRESMGTRPDREFLPINAGVPYRFYSCGRYALYDAFRLAGVGPTGGVLAPAYHCRTMIDPAVRLGAQVFLYHLDRKLMPDWESIEQLVESCGQSIRALLLTHFFGFPSCAEAIAAFCASKGITLIEDCSHAFYRSTASVHSLGSFGQFAVASPYKFVPAADGGLLIANSDEPVDLPTLRTPSGSTELRGLVRTLQKMRGSYRRRLAVDELDVEIARIRAAEFVVGEESDQPGDTLSTMYKLADEDVHGLSLSRWTMRASSADRIAAARRSNYRLWLDAVKDLPHCKALFPDLPDDVVPYMFPLYVHHPDPHFFVLKHLGVPIWRWDEMGISDCQLAMDYRLRLLHLPCHQALGRDEMHWMTAAVAKVLTQVPV